MGNQQLPQLRLLRFLLELLLLPRLQLSPRRQQHLPLRLDQRLQNQQQQVAAPSPSVLEQLRLQQHHPLCSASEGQALQLQQQHLLPSSQVQASTSAPPPPSNQLQGRSTSGLSNLQHQPATRSARLLQQRQRLAAQLQLLVLPTPPLEHQHQLLLLQPLDLCNLLLLNNRDLLSASVQEARIVPQARGALQLLEELGNSFDVLFPPLFLVKH